MTAATYDETQIRPPSKWLLFAEGGRALSEAAAGALLWPLLRFAPGGDGHTVLVLPGLLAGDASTTPLRHYLHERGYGTEGWGMGRNLGPRRGVEKRLHELLQDAAASSGRKVSIIGWSLGGAYARLLATDHPDLVRCVVTLGSPFTGSTRASNAWRVYEAVSGQRADPTDATWQRIQATPQVPTTSIYSRSDGVVAWQCSLEATGPRSENVEVIASHLGLGFHPAVLYALADRLAQPEGQWKPFDRRLFASWIYPAPAQRGDASS